MAKQPGKNGNGSRPPAPDHLILALRESGLSYQDIGDLVGRSKQTIHRRLQRMDLDQRGLDTWRQRKADFLESLQARLVFSVTDQKLKSMSAAQAILSFCQVYDKTRTELGQPGQYIQYSDFQAELDDVNQQIQDLELELAALGG